MKNKIILGSVVFTVVVLIAAGLCYLFYEEDDEPIWDKEETKHNTFSCNLAK